MSTLSSGHHGGLFLCESCAFEAVVPWWSRELWPGRKSPIEPTSAMKWLGGIDMALMQVAPSFWRVVGPTGAVVGVLSGHFGGLVDGQPSYRTRGLWVAESARRHGVARMLMNAAFHQARIENCAGAWTFPRQTSMPFYESCGFEQVGPWIGVDDPGAGEFGPNCFALARFSRTGEKQTSTSTEGQKT